MTINTSFLELFKGTKNAIDIFSSEELLAPGFLYEKLNYKFLDGWVSLVKLLRGWIVRNNTHPVRQKETCPSFHITVQLDQLERYIDVANAKITGKGNNCIEFVFNDYADYIQVWKQLPRPYLKLSELYDDVYLLGESCRYFWYFVYSVKKYNCKIGRIPKSDKFQQNMVGLFDDHIYQIQSEINATYGGQAISIIIPEEFLKDDCEF